MVILDHEIPFTNILLEETIDNIINDLSLKRLKYVILRRMILKNSASLLHMTLFMFLITIIIVKFIMLPWNSHWNP